MASVITYFGLDGGTEKQEKKNVLAIKSICDDLLVPAKVMIIIIKIIFRS